MIYLGGYVLLILAILTTVPIAMFVLEICASVLLVRPVRSPLSSQIAPPSVVILIPAHDEGAGIKSTIESALLQLRAGDRILVVADNCTDDTAAIATLAGAEVIKRRDGDRKGKGYALDFGVRHLADHPPHVLIVIDADCRFSDGSVATLASICEATARPVQSLNLMVAPEGEPDRFRFAEFAWRVKNWARPLGLSALHLPCQLTGTGMAFPWEVIKSAELASGEIVEDLKLGLELAMEGVPASFYPAARIVSHFPSTKEGIETQRQRWEAGHLRMIARKAPRLFWKSMAKGNLGVFFLTLDLMVPPLTLLAVTEALMFFLSGLGAWLGISKLSFVIVATASVAFGLSIILCWIKFGRDILPPSKLSKVPLALLQKFTLYRRLFTGTGMPAEWVRTDRGKAPPPLE